MLDLYSKYESLLKEHKIKKKKTMWEKIAQDINNKGYKYTYIQVENRFKTLERGYKKMIHNNNLSGRGRKGCAFQK